MRVWRRSLAEDAVDRYNHTWSVLLLLLLSFITWLVPLNYHSIQSSTAQKSGGREYTATCWCPAEFPHSYEAYSNAFCGSAFNSALRGDHGEGKDHGTTLFYRDTDSDVVNPTGGRPFRPALNSSAGSDGGFLDAQMQSIIRHIVTVTTPLMLFLFAVCLKLPHVIWYLISGCTAFSVDRTLETAVRGQNLPTEDRKQLNQDLSQATMSMIKSSPRRASLAYLLFKGLVCVVVAAEVVVVAHFVLPRINSATNMGTTHDGTLTQGVNEKDAQSFDGTILFCNMSVVQRQIRHVFSLQCVFTISSRLSQQTPTNENSAFQLSETTWLGMYDTLFRGLLTYLVLLLCVDVINSVQWISRLFAGSCHGEMLFSDGSLPQDVRLLLLMSQENAGPLVTKEIMDHHRSDREEPMEDNR